MRRAGGVGHAEVGVVAQAAAAVVAGHADARRARRRWRRSRRHQRRGVAVDADRRVGGRVAGGRADRVRVVAGHAGLGMDLVRGPRHGDRGRGAEGRPSPTRGSPARCGTWRRRRWRPLRRPARSWRGRRAATAGSGRDAGGSPWQVPQRSEDRLARAPSSDGWPPPSCGPWQFSHWMLASLAEAGNWARMLVQLVGSPWVTRPEAIIAAKSGASSKPLLAAALL